MFYKYEKGDRVKTIKHWSNGLGLDIPVGSIVTILESVPIDPDRRYMRYYHCLYKDREIFYELDYLGEKVEDEKKSQLAVELGNCMHDLIEVAMYVRPCEIDGERATFLRWIEDTKIFVKFDRMFGQHVMEELTRRLFEDYIIPQDGHVETVTNTLALVEMSDGTVKKVDPEKIKFIHKKG